MADWKNMYEAPRDAAVKLFLPCIKFQADEHGRPKPDTVEHGECMGSWDPRISHWVDVDTGLKVYPSKWHPLDRLV